MYDDRHIKVGSASSELMTSRVLTKIDCVRIPNSTGQDVRVNSYGKNARLSGVEKIRNLSEKKRRDQFNSLINDLSSVVSVGNRKMDKSTVMKAAIAFLRNHKEVADRCQAQESQDNWKPSFVSSEEFSHLMLEALDGFIIAFSMNGTILYTSDSVASLLGHLPYDLLNTSIYDLIVEENRAEIFQLLTACSATWSITPSTECQISFQAFVRRGAFETPGTNTFETVQFTGRYRRWTQHYQQAEQHRSQSISQEDQMNLPKDSGTGDLSQMAVVATARMQAPQLLRGISLGDATKSEFTSRHSLEWKFLFLDHRAPPIIGYLPFEVLGTSGYDYYHHNDLERVAECHEALALTGEGTSCHYRFLTKGQQWIWLQTRYYITYHQWNSKPEFIVCTHIVVSYSEAWSHLRQETTDHHHASNYPKNNFLLSPASTNNSRSASNPYRRSPTNSTTSANGNKCNLIPSADAIRQFSHVSLTTQSVTTVCAGSNTSVTGFPATLEVQVGTGTTSNVIHLLPAAPNQSLYGSIPNIEITAPTEDEIALPSQYNLIHDQSDYNGSSQSLLLQESPSLEKSLMMATYQPVFTMSSNSMMDSDYGLIPSPTMFNPVQMQLHEELRKKHQELQETILRQQEELRLVHEQLIRSQVTSQNVKLTPVKYPHIHNTGISSQTTAAVAVLFPEPNNYNFSHTFPTSNPQPTLSAMDHTSKHQIPQLELSSPLSLPPQQMIFPSDLSDIGLCLKEVQSVNL